MRRFCSYGPIDVADHYYVPRKTLIDNAYTLLMGDNPQKGGHYITVWAPRQTGKTWVMQEILFSLQEDPRFHVLKINLEHLKYETEAGKILETIAYEIGEGLNKTISGITTQQQFQRIFKNDLLDKPLILILDEFDALAEHAIGAIIGAFRNIYISRLQEKNKTTDQKTYLLHAVALVGVRSVLGIENQQGSPFNVQRSLHITNLLFDEVQGMFQWYSQESGQEIEPAVIEKLYHETKGQPGLTCWLGELLTEGYDTLRNDASKPILMADFERVYHMAMDVLPNNNIINLISKAKTMPYKDTVIELFKTDIPIKFKFDDDVLNYLYMNGIIEPENISNQNSLVKFASPFVQKRLFNYFSHDLFKELGRLVDSFPNVPDFIFPDHLDIPVILNLYQTYLDKNKDWLFKNAPRRSDLRVYEAVFHFNLYAYLDELLRRKVHVFPEFPTGNGKIDLLLQYSGNTSSITYGIELKSFSDQFGYRDALEQTAQYGRQLGLVSIYLVAFIESIDETNQKKYQTPYLDPTSGVTVYPIFIQTGRV